MLRGCCSNATTRSPAWPRSCPTCGAGLGRVVRSAARPVSASRAPARVRGASRRRRALPGACDALRTPRRSARSSTSRTRPAARWRGRGPGRAARRRGRRAVGRAAARSRRSCPRGSALGRRRDARRRCGCSPAGLTRGRARAGDLPRRRGPRRPSAAYVLGDLPAARPTGSRSRRCRRPRSRSSPSRAVDPAEPAPAHGRAVSFFVTEVLAAPGAGALPRHGARRRARPRGAAGRGRPRGARGGGRSTPRAPSCGCSRRSPVHPCPAALDARPATGDAADLGNAAARSATSWRARPWRRPSLAAAPAAAASPGARRAGRGHRPPSPTSPGSPIHAEGADDARGRAPLRPGGGGAGGRARAPTARPPREYARAVRYADGLTPARRAPRCSSAGPTSATSRVERPRRGRRAGPRRRSSPRARRPRAARATPHRWLSRLAWFAGDNAPPRPRHGARWRCSSRLSRSPELAMALLQPGAAADARPPRRRRRAASGATGRSRWPRSWASAKTLVHALNNVGVARLRAGDQGGYVDLAGGAARSRSTPGWRPTPPART